MARATKNGSDWLLTNATAPERIERTGAGPEDVGAFAGQRTSVSGMLMGTGGADGINVTTVTRVGEACP